MTRFALELNGEVLRVQDFDGTPPDLSHATHKGA